MQRQLLIGFILIALFAGGSSGVLAALLCPHAMSQSSMMERRDGASCYHAEMSQASEHCSSASHNKAMNSMAMVMPAAEMPVDAEETPATNSNAGAIGQPAGACEHCIGQNSSPAATLAISIEPNQNKRDTTAASLHTASINASPFVSFARPVSSRQGAPPGTFVAARKHLLIGVFII